MKDNKVYLEHIIGAIEQIEIYLQGVDYKIFIKDDMLMDAVIRELEIIGEAANNVSQDFQDRHQDIPWSKAISLRNKLSHEYFGVDLKVVWNTCQKDLPELKEQLKKII